MFGHIEREPINNPKEKTKTHFFPRDWSDDDDCDRDGGWNEGWDDFDLDAPQEDNDGDWVDWDDED